MKYDVKKVEELLYDSKFHIQDHDNKYQFYGIFKSIKPDELTFYISGLEVGSIIRGTYTFPTGSNFTMHKMKLDDVKKRRRYAAEDIISWKDITAKDESNEEEKDMKLDVWKDCVVKAVSLIVNDQIKDGDTIYRITTDYVDIKGKMTINNVIGPRISLEFDGKCGIPNTTTIYLMPEMRVFKTDSETDPGFLLQEPKYTFNSELQPGRLYRIVNSELILQFFMYVKSVNDNSIDVDIIDTITDLDCKTSIRTRSMTLDISELYNFKFDEIRFKENCSSSYLF